MILQAKPRYTADRTAAGDQPLMVGVVHDPRSVLHIVVARSRPLLLQALARWVEAEAAMKLPGDEATRIADLCSRGRYEAAVERYLCCVGRRWDEERLVIEPLTVEPPPY